MSPDGERTFVVVRSTDSSLGDGVLEINTRSRDAQDFIAFSGARLGGGGPGSANPPPVFVPVSRPGLVFSRDGRLLYAATGLRITIINTIEGKVVKQMADLPDPYKARAALLPTELGARLTGVAALAAIGAAGRPGTAITGLDLSPDGTRLYAVVQTGGGTGNQPGAIFAVNIDLYADFTNDERGLQADLANYFMVVSPPTAMLTAGTFSGGDEPSDLAVGGDGKFVYMVNGGVNFFEAVPPDNLDLNRYLAVFAGAAIGALGSGGAYGAMLNGLATLESFNNGLFIELALDIKQQAESGMTLLSAPGFTGVFEQDASGALTNKWGFPSDVVFGWNPPSANGGLLITQFRFPTIFAKRPSTIGLRPDGKRALLGLFQTGNFGVLDQTTQAGFEKPPAGTANPSIAGLADTMFHGVVGVTPALRLDNFLWPRRGALGDVFNRSVPSPDESLLYPSHVEYAQNGRFAVATHTGVGRPREVTVTFPDWTTLPPENWLFPLIQLGFTVSTGSSSGTDPEGNSVSVGGNYTFRRGGGAVSIINDAVLTNDFATHATQAIAGPTGTERAWFATNPICNGTANAGGNIPLCEAEAVTHWFDYKPGGLGTPVQFNRPRGATIQPFVYFELPRFGDHITRTQPIAVGWRDARAFAGSRSKSSTSARWRCPSLRYRSGGCRSRCHKKRWIPERSTSSSAACFRPASGRSRITVTESPYRWKPVRRNRRNCPARRSTSRSTSRVGLAPRPSCRSIRTPFSSSTYPATSPKN